MGRVKTNMERLKKQLDQPEKTKEAQPKGFRTKTILRKADQVRENKLKNDLVNGKFSQLTIPQKKG